MSKEFDTVIIYIEKMKSRYFLALSAFYAYEALNEQLSVDVVGNETAEENVKVFNIFNELLGPSRESLRVYFFLELAKLFDVSNSSLHITKIINYTQSNILKLTVNDFAEYGQDREFISRLVEDYKGVSNTDLVNIKSELEKYGDLLKRLKEYRDQYLAHDDLDKDEIKITGEEAVVLFGLLEKILNMFSSKLISTTSLYDRVEESTKHKTKMFFDFIKKYEPYRIMEINKEVEEEMKKYTVK